MSGNDSSELPNPQFLLDESLVPVVARALQLVGYSITDVRTALDPERTGRRILDPEIISWCGEHNSIWIHADDRARKAHRSQLQTSGIVSLRVHRPGGKMTGREQLRIVSFVIPKLEDELQKRSSRRHFVAKAQNPSSTPTLREDKA